MAILKPCPFCGSDRITIDPLQGLKRTLAYRMLCEKCGASTGWKQTDHEAVSAWASRAAENCGAVQQSPAPSPWAWRRTVYP